MRTRDASEALLKGWDRHERDQGRAAVIDFDCYPDGPRPDEITSRVQVHDRLNELYQQAVAEGDPWLTGRLRSDLAYVSALLGERLPLAEYLVETQGAEANGWPPSYIDQRREEAIEALAALDVSWGPDTVRELEDGEGRLSAEETAAEIQDQAKRFESSVRQMVGTDAPFTLHVEEVDIDAYWAYWMDGVGSQARLRINMRNAQFTKVRARQLALHEIHGHAIQGASFYQRALTEDVPWVRLLSVHAPQQILLEGLAQALPYFIAPDDERMITRTKFVHYNQLVRAELHLMINERRPIGECIDYIRKAAPYTSDRAIADTLNDRAVNPQLRSYLWSYAAGIDWFIALAEAALHNTAEILHACYQAPLQPSDLTQLWPTGPPIGGPGGRRE